MFSLHEKYRRAALPLLSIIALTVALSFTPAAGQVGHSAGTGEDTVKSRVPGSPTGRPLSVDHRDEVENVRGERVDKAVPEPAPTPMPELGNRTIFTGVPFGILGGSSFDWGTLDPADLDADLGGTPVTYGASLRLLIGPATFGGSIYNVVMHDLSSGYDEFSWRYGGITLGTSIPVRPSYLIETDILVGVGGLTMYKHRPDLSSGTDERLIEKFRDDSFFLLRPTLRFGVGTFNESSRSGMVLSLMASCSYTLIPKAMDLSNINYGIHLGYGVLFVL